jgi:hypothetical protein
MRSGSSLLSMNDEDYENDLPSLDRSTCAEFRRVMAPLPDGWKVTLYGPGLPRRRRQHHR